MKRLIQSKIPIASVAKVISGYAFKSSEFGDQGIPVIKIKNIQTGNIDFSDTEYVSEQYLSLDSKYHVRSEDILVSLTGSHVNQPNSVVGRVARYPRGLGTALLNQRAGKVIIKEPDRFDKSFLYYHLFDEQTRREIAALAHGAANQANVSPSQIESIKINLPSHANQKKIGVVLSAYDDLIENNIRRIKILEEMAQTLYREWFVKFHFPGHQKVKMVDSPLGKIPEGWEVSSLGSLCTLIKEPYREELHASFPLIDLARIPQKTLLASEVGSPKELSTSRIIFSPDDVLFGAIRPYLHKVVLAPTNGVTNVSVFVLRSREETLKPFLAILLSMEDTVRWADQYSTGTKMPVIKWDVFQKMKVLIPKKEVIRGFYDVIWPMMQLVKNTSVRNSNLRQTRDLLLPKLISVELGVSELDISIPEANA